MTASLDSSRRYVLPEGSLLLANMAALWAADPVFAAEMETVLDAPGYAVEPSKAGPPTLAMESGGRRIYLHSRYQPLDEARRLIEGAELDQKAIFCVHGFALGYHVEELFEKAGDEAVIVVLEGDLRLIRTAFEHRDYSAMLLSGRIIFLHQSDRSSVMLRLAEQEAMIGAGLAFVSHAPSLQVQAEFHRQMQAAIGEFVSYSRTSLTTLLQNGRRTAENIARNIGRYVACEGVGDLHDCRRGQPAIIVSAGPSLRKNKHLLADAAGKAVFIAVQTTLQPLLEMGVVPDFVTSLDYNDVSTRFFERIPRGVQTVLVAEPKASPAVLDLYPGAIRLLGNDFADKLVGEMKLERQRLRAGATVAHLAFYLAEHMGCDPIIFIGQDLGFSDGLCYTPGTSYDDVWRPELGRFCTIEMKQWEQIVRERGILKKIEDYQGRPMYTEERLFTYLQQFERDFAVSPSRIIDATEGGAMKRGAEVMTLGEAIGQFCRQRGTGVLPVADSEDAHGRDAHATPATLSACIRSLENRRSEAEQIERVSRDTLPLLHEIRDHLDDDQRVNRLIARVDLLRMKMRDLNDCYELVVQLNQQVEVDRFRSDRRIAASKAAGTERQRRQIVRDIAHVQGVIDAARDFQKLMGEAIGRLRDGTRSRRAEGMA